MTQLGEAVNVSEFVSGDKHSKSECPWCSKKKKPPGATVMAIQTPDEDSTAMPKNLGTALGKNLDDPPKKNYVWIEYEPDSTLQFKQGLKNKTVQAYHADNEYIFEYGLQYAPHHLIPGNESLKRSKIVSYLGDNTTIKNFGSGSRIKDGYSVGYDVNCEQNGVWLPSPYALSNSNEWPSAPGIKVIKKRLGQKLANATEDFKSAYVAAAIEAAGNRQFHMRHSDYSAEVRKILDAIESKLKLLTEGDCPIVTSSKKNKKFDPPMGLSQRLNVLSMNLKRLLSTGRVWRAPIFTDSLSEEYAKSLKRTKKKGNIKKVI